MHYALGSIRVDPATLTASAGGVPLPLGAKVVRALAVLCAHAGDVVTREALIAAAWPGEVVDESSLWQSIYVLRKALAAHRVPNAIENVRGRGYRLTGVVRAIDQARAPAPPRVGARLAAIAAVCVLAGLGPLLPQRRALDGESARLLRLASFYYDTQTEAGLQRSEAILLQLVGREPRSARAYAALADTETALSWTWGTSPSARTALARARTSSQTALRLDPNAAEAWAASAAATELAAGKFGVADGAYERAVALDPRYAHAYEQFGISLLMRGRLDDAVRALRVTADIDPATAGINAWLALAYYLKRQPGAAIPFAAQAAYLGDDIDDAHARLGLIYAQQRDVARATSEFALLRTCCPRLAVAYTAQAYAQSGDAARARTLLRSVQTRRDASPLLWLNVAIAQVLLDDRDGALRSLRHVPDDDAMGRSLLALDPRMDNVRGDPRFTRFVRLQ